MKTNPKDTIADFPHFYKSKDLATISNFIACGGATNPSLFNWVLNALNVDKEVIILGSSESL